MPGNAGNGGVSEGAPRGIVPLARRGAIRYKVDTLQPNFVPVLGVAPASAAACAPGEAPLPGARARRSVSGWRRAVLSAGRLGGARPPLVAFAVMLGVLAAGAACGRKIGDSCSTGADCDPSGGTRTCDLSQPGGYCVIEGCDARSCPSEAVCVRFFPTMFLDPTKACDPAAAACAPDELCLPDMDPATGHCVRQSLEKRACVLGCGGNGDCRGGYQCVPSGTDGTMALRVSPTDHPKFCVPIPPS